MRVFDFCLFIPGLPPRSGGKPGSPSFWLFFLLAKQKKVACCRATPGGFVFDVQHERHYA